MAQTNSALSINTVHDKYKPKAGVPSFIAKLYEILENTEHDQIIGWTANGSHFIIHDIKRLEETILPKYFRHNKFSSFVRQLNMYDFHKVRSNNQKNIFEHRYFRRQSKHLLKDVKRKIISKKNGQEADEFNYDRHDHKDYNSPEENSLQEEINKNSSEPANQTRPEYKYEISAEQLKLREEKNKLLEGQILKTLQKNQPKTQREIKQLINSIIYDQKYSSIKSKQHISNIYKILKESMLALRPKNTCEHLSELSIEGDMLIDQFENPESRLKITSLAHIQTEKLLQRPQMCASWCDL